MEKRWDYVTSINEYFDDLTEEEKDSYEKMKQYYIENPNKRPPAKYKEAWIQKQMQTTMLHMCMSKYLKVSKNNSYETWQKYQLARQIAEKKLEDIGGTLPDAEYDKMIKKNKIFSLSKQYQVPDLSVAIGFLIFGCLLSFLFIGWLNILGSIIGCILMFACWYMVQLRKYHQNDYDKNGKRKKGDDK